MPELLWAVEAFGKDGQASIIINACHLTFHVRSGIEPRNHLAVGIEHLAAGVHLDAAEGEAVPTDDRVGQVGRTADLAGPKDSAAS